MNIQVNESDKNKENLNNLLGFAQGILKAKTKTVPDIKEYRLGLFEEHKFRQIPGVSLDNDDGSWLRIKKLQATKAPKPDPLIEPFFDEGWDSPENTLRMKEYIAHDVSIDEASDLIEAGIARENSATEIEDENFNPTNMVRIVIRYVDCQHLNALKNDWQKNIFDPWAERERPVRASINLYQQLFTIHSKLTSTESSSAELIWGVGICRWRHPNGVSTGSIDAPLINFSVEIEVEPEGDIRIDPRAVDPVLALDPFVHFEIPGASHLGKKLKDDLSHMQLSGGSISPFTEVLWSPLLNETCAKLSSDSVFVDRPAYLKDGKTRKIDDGLAITAAWTIYGKPRSFEKRILDFEKLKQHFNDVETKIPTSLLGFVAPAPEEATNSTNEFNLDPGLYDESISSIPSDTEEFSLRASNRGFEEKRHPKSVTYFFPLPSNQEQLDIINKLEDPCATVVCVTGPPGTGKTHTIANIIGHYMATGRRVLVTARTAEAISAVREKLPEKLRPLVVASVGSDRASSEQLKRAVRHLSDEATSLDVRVAQQRRENFENKLSGIGEEEKFLKDQLARLTKENLTEISWRGETLKWHELKDKLEKFSDEFSWFSDRPDQPLSDSIGDDVEFLQAKLESTAEYLPYIREQVPDYSDIPTARELLDDHRKLQSYNNRERPDYSSAPIMAKETEHAIEDGKALIKNIDQMLLSIEGISETKFALLQALMRGQDESIHDSLQEILKELDDWLAGDELITRGRYELDGVPLGEFKSALAGAANGEQPFSFSQRLLNPKLVKAIQTATTDEHPPEDTNEWRSLYNLVRIDEAREYIKKWFEKYVAMGFVAEIPIKPWEMAQVFEETRAEIDEALLIIPNLEQIYEKAEKLFPVGLDIKSARQTIDLNIIKEAVNANIPEEELSLPNFSKLENFEGDVSLNLFKEIKFLKENIGEVDLEESKIITSRNSITKEIENFKIHEELLREISQKLDNLAEAGATELSRKLFENPSNANHQIRPNWTDAWEWAFLSRRLEKVVELGNGDQHRNKLRALQLEKEATFQELILTKTLLGLHRRLTPSVKQALLAFTDAITRLGKGTGKNAARFQLEAQKSAQKASSAAPVWIMPEHKIPEQIPASPSAFDLVVLDEASQSDLTVIAALARGKKVLIVGDEQQVSPSNVGLSAEKINQLRATYLSELPNSGIIDENTSMFSFARRMYPEHDILLKEHFRSVTPIIQFSTQFYSNSLIPMRVPKATERFDPPLYDVYVKDGVREGDKNEEEARFIVNEIAKIVEYKMDYTPDIGVISLSGGKSQAEYIHKKLLDDPRVGAKKISEYGILCGDPRTMQGQERSIVFLSMVVSSGQVRAATGNDFQQRLNVALSRARDCMYLVRSVTMNDLKSTDLRTRVLQHFADPLPDGVSAFASGTADELLARCDSDFEREVLKRLLDANYRVFPQVEAGQYFIDLVVEGAEDRRLAIELDGDRYHGPDKWDADMARQAQLERAGWVFWRVFGSQWSSNKDYWWSDLQKKLSELKIDPIGYDKVEGNFVKQLLVQDGRILGEDAPSSSDFDTSEDAISTSNNCDEVVGGSFETDGSRMDILEGRPKIIPDQEIIAVDGHSLTDYSSDTFPVNSPGRSVGTTPVAIEDNPVGVLPLQATYQVQKTDGSGNSDASPVLIRDNGNRGTSKSETLDADAFYEISYQPRIKSMAVRIIDEEAPITFKYLADRIAREHGFQRTAGRIVKTIEAAISGVREETKSTNGEIVYWSDRQQPSAEAQFRGLQVNGRHRTWADVPEPEKLALVREILSNVSVSEVPKHVAGRIGYSRVRKSFSEEIQDLVNIIGSETS